QRKVACGSEGVLLKAAEEEYLVLADRPAHSEAIHVPAENGLGYLVKLIHVGNGIEALRLVAPKHRPVEAVCSRLGNDIEDAAAGATELDAEIGRLHGDLIHRVDDSQRLRHAGVGDVIVFGTVQQVVITTETLPIHGVRRSPSSVDETSWKFDRARQSARQ